MLLSKVLIVFGIVAILFIAVRIIAGGEGFQLVGEMPGPAPPVSRPIAMLPRDVASGGPNSPSAKSLPSPPTIAPEEQPTDPYFNNGGPVPLEDSLRNPERSFSPAPMNNDTNISVGSGIASHGGQPGGGEVQHFSPELVASGGAYMDGIMANDMGVNSDKFQFAAF